MNQRVRKTHEQFMAACNAVARKQLLNRRIVEVSYFTPEECRRQRWSFTGVVLVLDDGTTLYPARDAEGNDAGALARGGRRRDGIRPPGNPVQVVTDGCEVAARRHRG